MAGKKKYDKEYKVQAVKLGREVGFSKAAQELGISVDTLYGWNKAAKEAQTGHGSRKPDAGERHESGGRGAPVLLSISLFLILSPQTHQGVNLIFLMGKLRN